MSSTTWEWTASGPRLLRNGAPLTGAADAVRVEADRRRCGALPSPVVRSETDALHVDGVLEGCGLRAAWSARRLDPIGDVWELRLELRNDGSEPVVVSRMDPLVLRLTETWRTTAFRSAWGDEFRPEHGFTDSDQWFETRAGRSSHGYSPVVVLERVGAALVIAPAWSGNWHLDVTDGGVLTAGISNWAFETVLAPGERVVAPSVVLAVGEEREDAAAELSGAVGRSWIPRSEASERLDVEWNHWWPYEDAEVDEGVIAANSDVAAEVGIPQVTVDAGWFGPADPDSFWSRHRGDWGRVNSARFPSGLAALGDRIRQSGRRPGIWIEAEAVGCDARLRRERPEIIALSTEGRRPDRSYHWMTESPDADDPTFLGYVCCGSEAGRAFVLESLDSTVREMGAEWVKLDFNVDPDAGCTRTDHGHGAGDGLLRHYEGLYDVLDRFRELHPEVVLEACASGGLRVDLGLARHVHCLFMSDPDYTEHALEALWGASLMLPAASILHWSWSQWRGDHPPSQLDFGALDDEDFAATLRAAMLHRFGVSLRLPELRASHRDILARHVEVYRERLAPLVRTGVIRRLTDQPLRRGRGERTPAFQLSAGDSHAVLIVGLDGGRGAATPRLDPVRRYGVEDPFTGEARYATGAEIASEGIRLRERPGRFSSTLVLIRPALPGQ